MSDIGKHEVGQVATLFDVFKQLIPIRCVEKDCNESQETYSIPVQLDELNPPKRGIIYICPKHYKQQAQIQSRIQYSSLNNQIVKQLKKVQADNYYEFTLHKANLRLQQNSCCMRENTKSANLERILTLMQISSGRDEVIFQLVKRLYIEQYFRYCELKQKIRQVSDDPLLIMHLIHQKEQLKKWQQQNMGQIIDSNIFLQQKNQENNDEQNQMQQGSIVLSIIPEQ